MMAASKKMSPKPNHRPTHSPLACPDPLLIGERGSPALRIPLVGGILESGTEGQPAYGSPPPDYVVRAGERLGRAGLAGLPALIERSRQAGVCKTRI